jgi:hypothetical protein
MGYAPDDRERRKPTATVTFAVYSSEPGDFEAGFEIDPMGRLAASSGPIPSVLRHFYDCRSLCAMRQIVG